MNRPVKITLWSLATIILIFIVALFALPFLVNLNDYKPQIATLVKDKTGRDLVIHGDIKLSIFPWLGAEIGAAEFSNAAGFGRESFAAIRSAAVKVKVMPLLQKKVEISKVTLKGLRLNLIKAANGNTNWADLMPKKPATPAPEQPAPPTNIEQTLNQLAIEGIEVTDTLLSFTNEATASKYLLENLHLTTGAIAVNEPVNITLAFDINSLQPPVAGHFEFSTEATYALAKNLFDLHSTELKINLKNTGSGMETTANLTAQAQADFGAKHYRIDNVLLNVQMKTPTLPKPIKLKLTTAGQADLGTQLATMPTLRAELGNIKFEADFRAEQIVDDLKLNGKVTILPFNVRTALKELGKDLPPAEDVNAFKQADFYSEISGSLKQLRITKLVAHLDESTLVGTAGVREFSQPQIKFNLNLDKINIDRYLPPKPKKDEQAQPTAPAPTPAPASSPESEQKLLETLRSLNIDGKFSAGQITATGLQLNELQVPVLAQNGVIALRPITAKLYEGSIHNETELDARGEVLKISTQTKVEKVQAGPVLAALLEKELITGTTTLNANLTMNGLATEQIMKTLSGEAQFLFANGAVKGINIAKMLRDAKAKLTRAEVTSAEPEATDFTELKGVFRIVNGIVSNDDLSAKTPLFRIGGKGIVDLPNKAIDYLVTATVVNTTKGQGGADLEDLKGLSVPVKIGGTFAAPSFKLDLQAVYGDKVKTKLKEEEARLKQQLDQQKAAGQQKLEQEKADAQQKLEAEKSAAQQKLEEEKKQQEQKLQEKLNDKLKNLF